MTESTDIKALGVLTFSVEGFLFAGDNITGSILAIDLCNVPKNKRTFEINVYEVDEQIAKVIGTARSNIQLNDLAVHPKSGEVYISVSRGVGADVLPVLVKVDAESQIHVVELSSLKITSQTLPKLPDSNKKVVLRGTAGSPPTQKEITKSKQSLRTLSIVAIEYYEGELFISGISNEEFCSVLRRIPFPFTGNESMSNIEMYHITHDNYESRAPIRAMVVKEIDGKDQLIAAYTCSPMVLIPLDKLKDNAKVKARTIGDMGNGQPIDMVPFQVNREEMLFVTNNSRSPLVIPVSGLNSAKVVTDKDFERGPKLDIDPIMPYGPMGKAVMFSGAALHIDLLNQNQFISINRDFETGNLDLETVSTKYPFRLHNIIGQGDMPNKWSKVINPLKKLIFKLIK
ncbi:MAG: hypothetical protein JXQ87_15590 [Bacteroidia bacterium]